jgi:hypothetical protein
VAEKKKRKGRRAYLNDFYQDVSGEYQYTGRLRRYEGQLPWRDAARRIGILSGAMALALVAVGMLPAPSMVGMGSFYVILPYILELVGVFLSGWSAVRLIGSGEELRSYVYEATVEKLPGRLTMSAIFAGASLAGNLVYLLLKGFGGKVILSLAVLALHGAVLAAALVLKGFLSSLRWSGGADETPEQPEA